MWESHPPVPHNPLKIILDFVSILHLGVLQMISCTVKHVEYLMIK